MIAYLPYIAVVIGTTAAMVTDLRSRKVYNALTFPMLLSGLVFQFASGGFEGLSDGLIGAVVGFGILLLPFILGLMGGGDLKLLAAVGAWLGFESILVVALIGCVLTGLYSLFVLTLRGGFREAWHHVQVSFYRLQMLSDQVGIQEGDTIAKRAEDPKERSKLIPFTILLGLGVLVAAGIHYLQR